MSQGVALCMVALALAAVAPPPAMASSDVGVPPAPGLFPVEPGPQGYFDYTLAPGATASGRVVLHDLTNVPAHYLIYAAGALTSPVGGVAYGQSQTNPHGPAAWVHLSTPVVNVASHGAVAVRFRVAVPAGTSPGDYVAAIAAQAPTPEATAGPPPGQRAVRLVTTTRAVVAVVVSVPGLKAPVASFGQPSVALQQQRRQVLTIPINDTGNALMKPYLSGNLHSCRGGPTVLVLRRQLDTFVPQTSIDYPWYLINQVLSAGCYDVTLELSLGAGGTVLATFDGALQVGAAATKILAPPGVRPVVVHAGLPAWLIPTITIGAVLFILTTLLLARARAERRRLLRRLADKDTPGGLGSP